MSSLNTSVTPAGPRERDPAFWAGVALVLLCGAWCLYPVMAGLWRLWSNDALRSIGMLVPPASLVLACRAWTRNDWRGGQWWGLLLVAAALVGVIAEELQLQFILITHGGGYYYFALSPRSVILFLYASGVVILFGGPATWRKAAFPLLLLLLVNPVPHAFSNLVDEPLQSLAAESARHFAALLGVPVSQGLLKMMFAPELGMFIAPGCDGLRRATTMGMVALVVGYLYRLGRLRWALFVLGSLLLAYLFNFVRLCGVVIYYWLALRFPSIGDYGAEVDYAIGGTLFLLASVLLMSLPRRWRAS